MARYLITYLGGDAPESEEAGKRQFEAYMKWLSGLGDAAVSPANPIMHTHTINPDGSVDSGGQTGMSGFTIVEADTLDDAMEMAAGCPFLEIGGSLEVSELMAMPG